MADTNFEKNDAKRALFSEKSHNRLKFAEKKSKDNTTELPMSEHRHFSFANFRKCALTIAVLSSLCEKKGS